MSGKVYFVKHPNGFIKIGYTRDEDVARRFAQLCRQYGKGLVLLGTVNASEYSEQSLHIRFNEHWYEDEWFLPADEILDFIATNAQSPIVNKRTKQKQSPKQAPISFYLGKEPDKSRRMAKFRELANRYSEGSVSRLIQMIADGELLLVKVVAVVETDKLTA